MNEQPDRLDRNVEQALEPGLAICDPHHHFWHYPSSRYLVDEFLGDIGGGHRILQTVFVECLQFYDDDAAEAFRPVGETATVDRMVREAQASVDLAAGIVGFADLTHGDAVRPVLEKHLETSPRFRGIRYATAWHADDRIRNAHTQPDEGLMSDPGFRAGISHIADLDLSFDAWLYHPQLPELASLARDFPALRIVLNHMAGPLGIGPYADSREETFRDWRDKIRELAGCENVFVKLGGRAMKMSGYEWHAHREPPGSKKLAAAMSRYFDTCIEYFGADRCMFESNFPVDKASCSYTILWNAFKRATRGYSEPERRSLFHDTAVRVYRLGGGAP